MSVPQANSALISEEPREVVDTTRWIPGTRSTACSSGRVTVGIMRAAGSSPTSAITLTMGKVTAGKIAEGWRRAAKTPPATRAASSRKIAAARACDRSSEVHGRIASGVPSSRPT